VGDVHRTVNFPCQSCADLFATECVILTTNKYVIKLQLLCGRTVLDYLRGDGSSQLVVYPRAATASQRDKRRQAHISPVLDRILRQDDDLKCARMSTASTQLPLRHRIKPEM
jgi:hypothetical protein